MGPARSGINLAIDAMPDKESKILHRRLAEHRANMEATLAGIKATRRDMSAVTVPRRPLIRGHLVAHATHVQRR